MRSLRLLQMLADSQFQKCRPNPEVIAALKAELVPKANVTPTQL